MSMDYDRSDDPITNGEGQMFAATPVWDRSRKRKGGLGLRRTTTAAAASPEPRSFNSDHETGSPEHITPAMAGPEYAAMAGALSPTANGEAADASMFAPISRRGADRRTPRPGKHGVAPAAIAAGIVALGAIGATGWYMSRDNDGVPELSPGQPVTSEIATAPTMPPMTSAVPQPTAAEPAAIAAAQPAPVRAEPGRLTTARARPALATSAEERAVNASATTLPDTPQPYTSVNPAAAPPTLTFPAPTSPTTSADAPAPVPSTPPTLPADPAPSTAPAETPGIPQT